MPAFALHVSYVARFPDSRASPLVFPAAWTAVWGVLQESPLGAFPSPAVTQQPWGMMTAVASWVGALGLVFVLAWAASVLALRAWRGRAAWNAAALAALLLSGAAASSRARGAASAGEPLRAACLLRVSDGSKPAADLESFWGDTAAAARSGAQLVLWSETAVTLAGGEEEEARLLRRAEKVAREGSAYLGVSYAVLHGAEGPHQNVFTLLRPGEGPVNASAAGPIAFRYQKAHPVPLVERGFAPPPLPRTLPFEASPWGRISAAVCFDLDFPNLIHQAGAGRADLLLQPAQTWGTPGFVSRHFRGNALRAAENGFTILRCSSDGLSGIAAPSGALLAAAETGAEGVATLEVPSPSAARRDTLYAAMPAGWLQLACGAGTAAAAARLAVERWQKGPLSGEAEEKRDRAAGRVARLEGIGDFGLGVLA